MRFLRCILLGGFLISFCGCAGYRLGPTNNQAAGDKTVQIVPITNQTLDPELGDAVTAALRKELQRDATYRLTAEDSADIVVTGTVTKYNRQALTFQPNDVITARDYRVSLTATFSARERSTGKLIFSREVTGQTLTRVGSDLTSTERQALPLLANDLARRVVAMLADGTW
jgi:hypothetical protein